MKKILVALMLCMVSIMGFRANPTTDNVEVLSDSIETNIETLPDSAIETLPDSAIHNVILNDSAYKVVEDGIIFIVKDGVSYDIVGRRIK